MHLSIPESLSKNHFPSLDGIRGIAILLVVIEHTWPLSMQPFHGNYGVYLFFVLSGFLITTLLLKEKAKNGSVSLTQFYIRRCLRIFPVAYLFIFVMIILNYVFKLGISTDEFLAPALYVENTTLFEGENHYMIHFWSLSIEEQFYVIFPVFIRGNARIYLAIICGLVAIIPVISYMHVSGTFNSFFIGLLDEVLRYMPSLLIGSLFSVALCYRLVNLPGKLPYRSVIVLFLLIAAGLLISKPVISSSISFTAAYVLIALMIVISLIPGEDPIFRLLNSKVLSTIGIYSYSLYIWQQIFTASRPWEGAFPGSDNDILNLAALAVVCYASYNFYEKKFLLLKDRFR
ncbi:MAG TPA: acyltransferase [Cyclobacteriaceae bacterium]|nr:acyltransferase [Cyclobacteriaceae bacterium]